MRQDHGQDRQVHGQKRRHADHPRRERVPVPDRGGASGDGRHHGTLPDDRGQGEQSGHPGGTGRGGGAFLLGRDQGSGEPGQED